MKMKRFLSVFLMAIIAFASASAQLPYSKLLHLNKGELKEKKFKYNDEKNQYILKKRNGLNTTLNIISALDGEEADIKPHPNDYTIVLQKGKEETSFLSVTFYKDVSFHDIQTWLVENNIDVIETNSGKLTKQKFNYNDYAIELTIEKVGVSTTTERTFSKSKSFDDSYNIYNYTIYTGVEPYSKWHEKEAAKKAKKESKGKKKDIDDLM